MTTKEKGRAMPWYKIEAHTGLGHQSHYLDYVWRDEKLTKEEKRWMFEDVFRDRDAVGDVVVVRRLPVKTRDQKIAMYKQRIEDTNKMLAMLTPHTERQ